MPEHKAGSISEPRPNLKIIRSDFCVHDKTIVSRVKDQAIIAWSSYWAAKNEIKNAKLANIPYNVVCCTVPALPSALIARRVARKAHMPLVIELRDAWPEILKYMDEWRDPHPGIRNPLSKLKLTITHYMLLLGGKVLEYTLKKANLIITTTESLAELERGKGLQNVVAVRNRADTGIPNCNEYPKHDTNELRVLYAGTVGRAQGLESAIRALAKARKRGANVTMRIAGGGAHINTIRRNAERLSVPVEFLGRIQFHKVIDQYRWADTILVHLRDWKPMEYTIPSKLFEAMWAEKHVSAAIAGEAAQIVTESGIGHVVSPMNEDELADLWVKLFHNRFMLEVDGRGANWFKNHPSVASLAKDWISAVEKLVEDSK
ncbi:hypothetical protein BK816_00495 [Boudabousia tangfeifanii]|uniref:Uncharacterized protein n=1 Tax=Boudabousia tangfeifanii TaxID=1912795 RepID=A0A1D9MI51_9ACTO|nr:hypothetical protein BK816_00495 [Boudabousia tangfeifanii]